MIYLSSSFVKSQSSTAATAVKLFTSARQLTALRTGKSSQSVSNAFMTKPPGLPAPGNRSRHQHPIGPDGP